jgi:hypothetical protein
VLANGFLRVGDTIHHVGEDNGAIVGQDGFIVLKESVLVRFIGGNNFIDFSHGSKKRSPTRRKSGSANRGEK